MCSSDLLVAVVVVAVLMVVVHRLAVPLVQALGGLVRKVSDSARFFTWCITPEEGRDGRRRGQEAAWTGSQPRDCSRGAGGDRFTFSAEIDAEDVGQLLHQDLSHLQRAHDNLQVLAGQHGGDVAAGTRAVKRRS